VRRDYGNAIIDLHWTNHGTPPAYTDGAVTKVPWRAAHSAKLTPK